MSGDTLAVFAILFGCAFGAVIAAIAARGTPAFVLWVLGGAFSLATIYWAFFRDVAPKLVAPFGTVVSSGALILPATVIVVLLLQAGREPRAVGSASQPAEGPPLRSIPQMRLGDVVRYIAKDSTWPAHLSTPKKWEVELERELVDQLSSGVILAAGRFTPDRSPSKDNTTGISEIDPDFWKFAAIKVSQYFLKPEDSNFVWSDYRGYSDIRLHKSDVERIWPPQNPMHPLDSLPGLEEALAAREVDRVG